jgi:peptidoglycan/LPS O-acetylase OafA/YrhL
MKQEQRIFGLDILRALSIVSVVVVHMWVQTAIQVNQVLKDSLYINGVNIFFVLSGYLVGNILLRNITEQGPSFSNLRAFWRDRWLRTLPAYYSVLIVIVIISLIYTNKTWHDCLLPFLFSQNLTGSHFTIFNESWSLAVEEWFYLVIPILLFAGANQFPLKKVVPAVIILVLLFSNVVRISRAYQSGLISPVIDSNLLFREIDSSVPTRIDNIVFGLLGAWLGFYKFNIWIKHRNLFFAIGMIGFFINHFLKVYLIHHATANSNTYIVLFHTQVELLFVLMIFPKLSSIKTGKGYFAGTITFVSRISYSIYLIHLSLFILIVRPRFPINPWILLPVYWLWNVGGGYLLHITIEKWGMKYRAQLRKKSALKKLIQTKNIVQKVPAPINEQH